MVSRYCIHHGIVPPDHYCHDGVVTTRNRRRHAKALANGTKSRHWRQVRAARLALDNGACQLRVDHGCTRIATTVHLDPELRGNHRLATLDNTRSACRHCHGVIDGARTLIF